MSPRKPLNTDAIDQALALIGLLAVAGGFWFAVIWLIKAV